MISAISNNNISNNQVNNDRGIEIQDETNIKSPKRSRYWDNFTFIHIDNNWSLYEGFEWVRGNGSWGNPYIIENITMDASSSPIGSGIFIENSKNDYFIINNCTVYNTGSGINDAGIKLENTNNGSLTNNNCSDNNRYGISLYNNCENNTISGNIANNNTQYGIYLADVNNAKLSGNQMTGCGVGIFGSLVDRSSHTIYINNKVNGKPLYYYVNETGLDADNFTGSGQVILINCSDSVISNLNTSQGSLGIHLYSCDNNTVSGNTANNNTQYGIYLENYSENNTISGNTANNNVIHGIYLYSYCDNNTISGNTANNNAEYGIYLRDNCNDNNISGNTANDNLYGIYLGDNCNDNNISGNTASNTITSNQDIGIYLYDDCDDNIISENTVNDNVIHGIYLWSHCDDNKILNNTVNDNLYGIYLVSDCDNNNITANDVNDNDDRGIYLYSGCDDNTIKKNTINRNNLGIGLYQQSNRNNVSENTLKDNGWCIFESECTDNIRENNDCSGSTKDEPIFINGTGVGAHNWTWAVSEWGFSGSGTEGAPYIIENLNIDGFGITSCIEIINSNAHFIIKNCTVSNSGKGAYEAGIDLQNTNNGTIFNNTCSNNGGYGILLYSSCNINNISGNSANDNILCGIYLENDCDNNTISGNDASNTITSNQDRGISLGNDCDNNTISGNKANKNTEYGIYLRENCDNNTISGNNASNTITANKLIGYGIYLRENCDNNTISGNNANNNKITGIHLKENCNNNTISGNTVKDNRGGSYSGDGIYLEINCNNNTIVGNTIRDNPGNGLTLISSNGNLVYNNNFTNNGPNVLNSGGKYNKWDNGTIGNYWDDYYPGVDADDDGIGDTPYKINFGCQDNIPIWWDAPALNITKPRWHSKLDGKFNSTAPTFHIRVDQGRGHYFWYEILGTGKIMNLTKLNGDLNENITGSINQTLWSSLSYGYITILFYCNDTRGYIGYSDVYVFKEEIIPEPGLPVDDDDDDGYHAAERAIPGYNIFILIGLVGAISAILFKKRLNLKPQY